MILDKLVQQNRKILFEVQSVAPFYFFYINNINHNNLSNDSEQVLCKDMKYIYPTTVFTNQILSTSQQDIFSLKIKPFFNSK